MKLKCLLKLIIFSLATNVVVDQVIKEMKSFKFISRAYIILQRLLVLVNTLAVVVLARLPMHNEKRALTES